MGPRFLPGLAEAVQPVSALTGAGSPEDLSFGDGFLGLCHSLGIFSQYLGAPAAAYLPNIYPADRGLNSLLLRRNLKFCADLAARLYSLM